MSRRVLLLALAVSITFAGTGRALAGLIRLKTGTINTEAVSEPLQLRRGIGSDYYLVEVTAPVTQQARNQLASVGADIVEYIPDSAFLVRIDCSALQALRKLDCVEWVGRFDSDCKWVPTSTGGAQRQYLVKLFPGCSIDHVRSKGRMLGIKSIDAASAPTGALWRVLATESQIDQLSQTRAVSWIEPYIQPRLCNDVSAGICAVPEARLGLGIYGAGQIVGVADAGLDTGDVGTISADFAGRIYKTYALRRPGDWSCLNGHGTHVTGTLLGSGVLSGSSPAAHDYSGSFAGVAPEAQLVFQSIGDDGAYVFPPLHLAELFQPPYNDGVRVHNNSWGSAAAGQYTVYSNEVDQFIWDNKDFTAVYAVGNEAQDLNHDGIADTDNLYAPATAKNCISVGATESLRLTGGYQMGYGTAWPSSFPAAPIKYDTVSNNADGMVAFSGRGPTDDGRIKPDICAPGTNIVSCRTHRVGSALGWGLYNADYIYWGGTSMAAPQVSGAAALTREFYQKEKGINPSAALIKATLINAATDVSPGQYGTGSTQEVFSAPDYSQGWGRLNLKQALVPDLPAVNEFADESSPLYTGEYRDYHYTVIDNTVPFQATLVWTDYPGAVHAAKELVNDLDLTVIAPGGATYPVGGASDHTNNVERIRIDSPEIGTHTVRVTAYDVPVGPQDYALVVTGGFPNTYISGCVTSVSGAPVQGALITLVSAFGTKRHTTNASGKYVSHVEAGTYSVQVSKPGWTFDPPAQVVEVVDTGVDDVNFVGSGQPGGLSGTITAVTGGIVSHTVESPHPYLNNCDQTYVITAHEGASQVRVHFAEIDLMDDGDTIYVLDSADSVVNTFTGSGEDIWSSWVSGNLIKIRLVTNEFGNIGYGFYSDGYETDLIDQGGLAGAVVSLEPGGYSTNTGEGGAYTFDSIPPGTYTVTPSLEHWKFEPASKVVEIPAGGSVSGIEFLAFPPGSITGEVRIAQAETYSVNVQSPHPYPDNYEETWQVTADPGTTRMRLHFSQIYTEPGFDFVYILDGQDNIVEIYTAYQDDLWTPWIDGSVARIMLTSDDINNDYGFRCDGYEAEIAGEGLQGAVITLSPDGRTTQTNDQGAFGFSEVDVGSHTLVPELPFWSFDPPSQQVSVSPGLDQHILFYATVHGISKSAQAKFLPDGVVVTIPDVTVSAVFDGFFYVQDSDNAGGLRVVSAAAVEEGDVVDLKGTLDTVDGERRLNASEVIVN